MNRARSEFLKTRVPNSCRRARCKLASPALFYGKFRFPYICLVVASDHNSKKVRLASKQLRIQRFEKGRSQEEGSDAHFVTMTGVPTQGSPLEPTTMKAQTSQ